MYRDDLQHQLAGCPAHHRHGGPAAQDQEHPADVRIRSVQHGATRLQEPGESSQTLWSRDLGADHVRKSGRGLQAERRNCSRAQLQVEQERLGVFFGLGLRWPPRVRGLTVRSLLQLGRGEGLFSFAANQSMLSAALMGIHRHQGAILVPDD